MSKVWFGSLENRLAERCEMPKPEVGMGVTEMFYSDREPYEIVRIKDDRHIFVRKLDWKIIRGSAMDGSAEYEYFSNENNPEEMLFLTKQGQWRARIGRNGLSCNSYVLGYAEHYRDPSF